jgi:hypothetical protein
MHMQPTEANGAIGDREVIGEIMTAIRDEIRLRWGADPAARAKYLRGDSALEDEAVTTVCARAGVSPDAYERAVQSDPALVELHHSALEEALIGPVDPGPNAQISRESPTGSESNEHWNDWMARGNSP